MKIRRFQELQLIFLVNILSIFVIFCGAQAFEDDFENEIVEDTRLAVPAANDRTLISEIIGFSAFKLLAVLAIPLVFSIFLGAMLVLLFPFPLLTSTSGLAGAAAVGRRSGREFGSQPRNTLEALDEMDFEEELMQLLGLKSSTSMHTPMTMPTSITYEAILPEDPLPPLPRVKKQFRILNKPKPNQNTYNHNHHYHHNHKTKPKGQLEMCAERIACEIGRNADSQLKTIVTQALEELPSRSRFKWKSTIHAYLEGAHQLSPHPVAVPMSDSLNPTLPQLPFPIGPVYPHNTCPKYKCEL